MIISAYFSIKTYVGHCGYSLESPHRKLPLDEAILMRTHNIRFDGELKKIILQLS